MYDFRHPTFKVSLDGIFMTHFKHAVVLGKVLARSVSSRPVDAHFSKKYKENSLNLWKARFHCLAKSLVPRPNYSARPMHFWSRDPRASSYVIKKMY